MLGDLMRRAFELDVLACSRCGSRMRLIVTTDDPRVFFPPRAPNRGSAPAALPARPTDRFSALPASPRPSSIRGRPASIPVHRPGSGSLTGVRFTPANFLLDSPLLRSYPCYRTRTFPTRCVVGFPIGETPSPIRAFMFPTLV